MPCCRLDILCWQECADLRWKQWALIRMLDFFHTDRPGRMSLALDLMEEFRSVMVDRFVLTLINKRIMKENYFMKKGK